MTYDLDEDAMTACVDLVGRTGAVDLEFGYLDDDVPIEQARWYANARYRGARITVENKPGPVEALEALARRLFKDSLCRWCGRPIALSGNRPDQCRWRRETRKYVRGCAAWKTDTPELDIPPYANRSAT